MTIVLHRCLGSFLLSNFFFFFYIFLISYLYVVLSPSLVLFSISLFCLSPSPFSHISSSIPLYSPLFTCLFSCTFSSLLSHSPLLPHSLLLPLSPSQLFSYILSYSLLPFPIPLFSPIPFSSPLNIIFFSYPSLTLSCFRLR